MFGCRSLSILLALLVVGVDSTSRVSVQIPQSLHKPDGEEHIHAHFGNPNRHRGHLGAYVHYVPDLCFFAHPPKPNDTDNNPVHPFALRSPFILMTNTSKICPPLVLARHAQLFGASAVVFAHSEDKNCTDVDDRTECIPTINDGTGGDVSIPSFLLFKSRADKIIGQIHKNQSILMELAWGLNNKTLDAQPPKIQYNLWSTANDPLLDVLTIEHYKNISTVMGKHGAHFEPKFSIISGKQFGCDSEPATEGPCAKLCTHGGNYCALNAGNVEGRKVVNETLRRLCIWSDYGTKSVDTYWDYVIYYMTHCSGAHYGDESCIRDAYEHTKISEDDISKCMSESSSETENVKFDKQLEDQENAGIVTTPALTVDGHILEDADSFVLFEGICHHFFFHNWTRTPEICYKCVACSYHIDCLTDGQCKQFDVPKGLIPDDDDDDDVIPAPQRKKRSRGWVWFWAIALVGGAVGGYVYYKKQQEGGSSAGVLNSYFQLSGDEPIA